MAEQETGAFASGVKPFGFPEAIGSEPEAASDVSFIKMFRPLMLPLSFDCPAAVFDPGDG
jgi:hypothetical protein